MNEEAINQLVERTAERAAEKAAERTAQAAATAAVEQMVGRMQQIADEAATKAVARATTGLQLQIDELKRDYGRAFSCASSVTGPTASTDPWVPQGCSIKGYVVDWADPDSSSVLWAEAKTILDTVSANLSEDFRTLIDVKATADANSHRTFLSAIAIVMKKADRRAAWKLRDAIQSTMDTHSMKLNERPLRCTVETEPSKRPLNRAAGKFHGLCETAGVGKSDFKIEYRKDGGDWFLSVMRLGGGRRPARMGTYKQSTGWDLDLAQWALLRPTTDHSAALTILSGA